MKRLRIMPWKEAKRRAQLKLKMMEAIKLSEEEKSERPRTNQLSVSGRINKNLVLRRPVSAQLSAAGARTKSQETDTDGSESLNFISSRWNILLDKHTCSLFMMVVLSEPAKSSSTEMSKECAICTVEFEDDEPIMCLPNCIHVFHDA